MTDPDLGPDAPPATVAFVSFASLLMGITLMFAPWTSLWEANYLLQPLPALRPLALHPVMRGLVSGLGLVNMVLAVADVVAATLRRP